MVSRVVFWLVRFDRICQRVVLECGSGGWIGRDWCWQADLWNMLDYLGELKVVFFDSFR